MKKTVCLLLCLTFFLTVSACSGKSPEPVEQTSETTEQASETAALYSTELPPKTFGGEPFLILTYQDANAAYTTLETTADEQMPIYEYTKYTTTTKICEQYRIDLIESVVADNMTSFSNTILSGDDFYALGNCRCTVAYQLYQQGLVISYDRIPNLNLDAPYWDKEINECLSVQGDHYVAVGKYNMSTYGFTHTLLFNKGMITSYGFDNLYGTVTDRNWTFEEMLTMMNTVHSIDNEGETLVYGYLAHAKEVLPSFWIAAGVTSVSKDSERDIPYLSAGSQRFSDVFDTVYSMLWDTGNWMVVKTGLDVPEECINTFASNKSLFMDCTFDILYRKMRMYDGYGIIPYPMQDADLQRGEYSSRVEYYIPAIVPRTTGDLDRTGYILEVLNCEFANYVLPVYYERCLLRRSAIDTESAEMLEYIFDHRVIDIGDTTLNGKIRDGIFEKMFRSNNRNLASQISNLQTVMEEFVAGFPQKTK